MDISGEHINFLDLDVIVKKDRSNVVAAVRCFSNGCSNDTDHRQILHRPTDHRPPTTNPRQVINQTTDQQQSTNGPPTGPPPTHQPPTK